MSSKKVLDVPATSNRHIEAGDDDSSVIYFHGEYRTINDILLDSITEDNRNIIIEYGNIDGGKTTVTITPKISVVRQFDIDYDADRILTEDEIISYISAVRDDIGFTTDMDRKQLVTIRTSILWRMLHGEIDHENYKEIISYIDGVI